MIREHKSAKDKGQGDTLQPPPQHTLPVEYA